MNKFGGRADLAWDEDSIKADAQVKLASQRLRSEMSKIKELTWQQKLDKEQIPFGHGACQPDGGLWFWKGKLIMSSESKKQNGRGNAIERWAKNFYICSKVNPRSTYLTLAVGEGVLPGKPIYETLYVFHEGKYNVDRIGAPTCHMREKGFTDDEVYDIMRRMLTGAIALEEV